MIPWVISDSNFVRFPSSRLDPQKTVFVGALHGMLTAEGLCNIFNDLFGGVVYAGGNLAAFFVANILLLFFCPSGVDTDKYKYPIGSGRVTFNNNRSYMKAVSAAFIEIKTTKFTKKVSLFSFCSSCESSPGGARAARLAQRSRVGFLQMTVEGVGVRMGPKFFQKAYFFFTAATFTVL